jgi:segregation and condensation protein B
MAEDNVRSAIEALLFVSEKPLLIEQIKKALSLDAAAIINAIKDLKSEYEQSNRGIRLYEVAGGYRLISAPEFAPFLRKLYKSSGTDKLSKQALETLAIIAYKQPVTRVEIEALRRVNVDGVMKSLVDKNLIRIVGRKKAPGSPFVFGTNRQFLEYFGLKSLEELPKLQDLKANLPTDESLLKNDTEVLVNNSAQEVKPQKEVITHEQPKETAQ